jgi:hypothetical protein
MLNIKLDAGAEEIGLAPMLTELMRQNVRQHPKREDDFNALRGSIAIEARDAEVALTLDFRGGELVVYGGVKGKPDVVISTDSGAVLELSNAKLRFGLPDLADPSGRAVVKKMLSGELKISGPGLVTKPKLLVRFTKLLSVNLDAEIGLQADETVAEHTGMHGMAFGWPAVMTLLAVVGLFVFRQHLLAPIIIFVVAAVMWLETLLRFTAAEFTVTNKRLLCKTGALKTRYLAIDLSQVEEVAVRKGFGGYGALSFRAAGGVKESFPFVVRADELVARMRELTKAQEPTP